MFVNARKYKLLRNKKKDREPIVHVLQEIAGTRDGRPK